MRYGWNRRLAQKLQPSFSSLDGPADPDAEEAWATEIERRVKALEAGDRKA